MFVEHVFPQRLCQSITSLPVGEGLFNDAVVAQEYVASGDDW